MSKEAIYGVEIECVSLMVLQKAIQLLTKELKAERLSVKEFMIYGQRKIQVNGVCMKLQRCAYPIDVAVINGKLTISGDSMDVRYAAGVLKQFYGATEVSMKFRSEVKYNQKTRELDVLLVGV
jgi:hypothetical protein